MHVVYMVCSRCCCCDARACTCCVYISSALDVAAATHVHAVDDAAATHVHHVGTEHDKRSNEIARAITRGCLLSPGKAPGSIEANTLNDFNKNKVIHID